MGPTPRLPEPKINLPQHNRLVSAHPAQPRAIGEGAIIVSGGPAGRTDLNSLRQAGATKLVFPRRNDGAQEAIIVNTAGGITGGDSFRLDATAGPGGCLTLTTQAAERAYRAQDGEIGQVETHLTVSAGGALNWLPQELILFECCALRRRLNIVLEGDARLLMVEPVVFGRLAMAEELRNIRFSDRISIYRNSKPLYLDHMDLKGDAITHLSRPAVANGARAMASMVLVSKDAQAQIDTIRSMLPATGGASLLAPDVMVVRQLAPDSFELRRDLIPILDHLTDNSLPISWRL